MSISQAQVTDTLGLFYLFISFLLHINLWCLGLLLSFITLTQPPLLIPSVISPVAGASFFGASANTRPSFILSPQYHTWNFDLGAEVALLVIWIINTSTAILRRRFFFFQRGKENKIYLTLLESVLSPPPPCRSLPLNKGWAISFLLNTIWNPGNIQSMPGNRMCSRRWIAPLAVFTYRRPCLCTHIQCMGGGRNGWLLVQIYISHHCSLSFGINFVTGAPVRVYYSVWQQVWAVCALSIHCPPGSGFIQSHTLSFQSLLGAWTVMYLWDWCCTMPVGSVTGSYPFQPG